MTTSGRRKSSGGLSVNSVKADAVAEYNSTPYGLASTVMSSDLAKAARVANGIRAGACTLPTLATVS